MEKDCTFWNGYITGQCNAIISILAVDQSVAAALLPPGLELVPQSVVPPGFHPIYLDFVFLQSNVTTAIPGQRLNYQEFMLAVPFVKLKHPLVRYDQRLFVFAPLLYLNDFWALLGGRMFWAFAKEFADIHAVNRLQTRGVASYDIASPNPFDRKNHVSANFHRDGESYLLRDSPFFRELTTMFHLPMISHGPLGYMQDDYGWNLTNAIIQPVIGEVHLSDFLPPMSFQSHWLKSIRNQFPGSFQLTHPWTLPFGKFVGR